MTKTELRRKYKNLRQSLSDDQIEDYSISIANRLLKLDIWDYSFYHIFLTMAKQNEVNTDYILNILAEIWKLYGLLQKKHMLKEFLVVYHVIGKKSLKKI